MEKMLLTVVLAFFSLCISSTHGLMRSRYRPYLIGLNKNSIDVHHLQRMAWNDFEDNHANYSMKEISCNSFPNHVQNSMESYKSVGCKPRKTVIPITSSITQNQFMHIHPTHVEVDRCSGMCASDPYIMKSCLPTKVRNIEIPITAVVMRSPEQTKAQCFLANVEEHVECDCDCSVKEKHCYATKQIYNKNRCRCECKNVSSSTKCGENKVWDPVTCSCECAEEMPCSTGYLFHPEYCTCVKIILKKQKKSTKATKFQRTVIKRPPT